MNSDTITWGETYDISVTVKNADGAAITIDGTWAAACTIRHHTGGGAFLTPTLTIADGAASASIDTGDSPWSPGIYLYDIRLTDPGGDDYWSEPVQLILRPRHTPAS